MKKRILLLILSALMLFLCSCGKDEEPVESTATCAELMDKVMEKVLWENTIYTTEKPLEEIYFAYYFGAADKADFESVVGDYAFAIQNSNSADEVGIFKVNTAFDEEAFRKESSLSGDALERAVEKAKKEFVDGNITRAKEFSNTRIQIFLNQTANYDPGEYAKAQGALVNSYGNYVYYIISGDNASIEGIIKQQIDAKAA